MYKKKYFNKVFGSIFIIGVLIFFIIFFIFLKSSFVKISVNPSDSLIKLGDLSSTNGKLSANLRPGNYDLEISRKGFKTYTGKVELKRNKNFKQQFKLDPLPYKFSFETKPKEAKYFLTLSDGSLREGKSLFEEEIPAGQTKIKLEADSYNLLEKEIFLDQETDITLWMDKEGQILHLLNIFESGPAPKGVAFRPGSNEIWVTRLVTSPAVGIYDPSNNKLLDEINLGNEGGVEVIFSQDGSKAFVTQMQKALVYEIDAASRKITRTFDTKSAWSKIMELSNDGKTLFVSNWSGNNISEIDLESGNLRRLIPTVDTPRGLYATPDGKKLYVAGFGKGELEQINLEDGSRKLIYESNGAMRHIVANEERGVLYVSDMAKNCIWQIDLKTNQVKKFIDTDNNPNTIVLSPDKKVLFVSCRGKNYSAENYNIPGPEWGSVLAVDSSSGKILDAIIGGNQCTALDISLDGKNLIFSDFLDNHLRFYEIPDYEVLIDGNGGRAESYGDDLHK